MIGLRFGFLPTVTLAGSLILGACGGAAEPEVPADLPPRDLSLLQSMLTIDAPWRSMQPRLRNVSALDQLAQAAQQILDACEDPVFAEWHRRPDFERDTTIWERSYAQLREGAQSAHAAALAGDLDRLHTAYSQMSASCTACHKRYSPHQ